MSARPSQEEINKVFTMLKNINTPNGVDNALIACNALAPGDI